MEALLPHKHRMIRLHGPPQCRRLGFSLGAGVLVTLALLGPASSLALAAGVRARFDLDDRRGSPFPSDRFTVADTTQNTGLRVNVPKPDCTTRRTTARISASSTRSTASTCSHVSPSRSTERSM
jgi:hypothetical protein